MPLLPKMGSHVGDCALKGACIGGLTMGLVGFIGATIIIMLWSLPLPPMLTFEGGALVGGLLGSLIGVMVAYKFTRFLVYGLLGGGVAIGLCALILQSMTWVNVGRLMFVGILVGVNAAFIAGQRPPHDGTTN